MQRTTYGEAADERHLLKKVLLKEDNIFEI